MPETVRNVNERQGIGSSVLAGLPFMLWSRCARRLRRYTVKAITLGWTGQAESCSLPPSLSSPAPFPMFRRVEVWRCGGSSLKMIVVVDYRESYVSASTPPHWEGRGTVR